VITAIVISASRHALALFYFAGASGVCAILVSHWYLPPFYGLTARNFSCPLQVSYLTAVGALIRASRDRNYFLTDRRKSTATNDPSASQQILSKNRENLGVIDLSIQRLK
jgi:hypothetical protein